MSGMVRRGGGGGDNAAGSKSNGATSSSAGSSTGSGGSGVVKLPPRQLWCPAALRAAAAARAGSSSGAGSSSSRLDGENGSKDSSRSVVARGAAKGSGTTLGYPAPRRTVTLFEEAPLYLDNCPQWLKSHSLWSPRLSPRLVDVTRLGEGRHGSVALVTQRAGTGASSGSQQRAVLKQFVRERLLESPRVHQKVLSEWRVHSGLTHEFIVPLYGAVEDRGYVTFLMEAQQGDLLWYLDEQESEVMGEDEARAVMADVLAALCYMHEMGYVHRDIKPENIFLSPGSGGGPGAARRGARRGAARATSGAVHTTWRLGDLGSAVELAEVMQRGAPGLFLEGSPPFLAPEYAELWVAPSGQRTPARLQQATSFKQDIWALGATLYDILVGHPPFSGPAGADPPMSELAAAIVSAPPHPHPAEVPGLSPAAADFICWTLQKDPALRPTAFELVEHPWLMGASEMPSTATVSVQHRAANVVLTGAALAEAAPPQLVSIDPSMAEEAAREVAAAVIADLAQSVDAAGLATASAKTVTAAHAAAAAAADAGPGDGGSTAAPAPAPLSPSGKLTRSKSVRKTPASPKKSQSALATAAAALLAVADPTQSGDSPSCSLDAGSLRGHPALLASASAPGAPVPRRKASARRVPSRKTGTAPEAVEGTVVGSRLVGIAELPVAAAPLPKARASRKAVAGAMAQSTDGATSEPVPTAVEAASTSAATASLERSLTPKRRGRKPASGSPAATTGPATSLLLVPGLVDLPLLDPTAVVVPGLQPGAAVPKVARTRVRKAAASPLAAASGQDSPTSSSDAPPPLLMVSDEAAAASALATAAAVMVAGVATAASGAPRSRGRKQAEAAAAAAAAASTPAGADAGGSGSHALSPASDSPSASGSLDEEAVAGPSTTTQGSPAKRRGRKPAAAAAAAAAPGSPGGPVRLAPAAPAVRKTGEAMPPAVGGAAMETLHTSPAVGLPPTASLLARPSGEKIDWLHMF